MRYKTVSQIGEAEITEKKSRFIATVCPVETEQQAQEIIEGLKKKYWNARHNCFAYQLNGQNPLRRFSDDGEPQGTAGKPILEVLTGGDIRNTLIVVTRYFGGVLLGTGGLVRAYSKSAKEGLEAANVIEKVLYDEIHITVDYTLSGKVQYEIIGCEKIIMDTLYTDKVEFVVFCEKEDTAAFTAKITDVTGAKAEIAVGNEVFASLADGKIII